MSINSKLEELVQMLTERTRQKQVQWQVTADEETFRLASNSGNVRVTRHEGFDQESMESYVYRTLQILNDRGRVIEEYSPKSPDRFAVFDELFTHARRSAYKTEDVLDQLMMELSV
ncbi:MAG TPA: hypothetical protein VHR66_26820 [Gemmataceae bacterium]|jgi:hypothetical protein|nr:hypothetical protein [Gemmataceae bacterium]